MAATTPMYGRKYQKGVNIVTTLAMIAFHAGAITALFFIDGGATTTVGLHAIKGPASDTPWVGVDEIGVT